MDSPRTVIQPPQRVTAPFLDVLAFLVDHPDGGHGYQIARATHNRTGTVCNVLSRLVEGHWAVSHLDQRVTPPRKVHVLTLAAGTQARELLARRRPPPPPAALAESA